MQSFEPSIHTKLVNLSILLGLQNETIEPRLLTNGYPIKSIGLRIPLPELGQEIAVVPDTGFSSSKYNSILFIECKSGGTDHNGNTTQLDKFEYVQQKNETVLRTKNEFEVQKTGLKIDFAILCSDLEKIKDSHEVKKIIFPVIHYDQKRGILERVDFNNSKFKNSALEAVFSNPVAVKRVPIILYPFGPYDVKNNYPYIIKNVFLMIVEANLNLKRFERMPPLDQLLITGFPMLKLMDRQEFDELVNLIEKIFLKIFPDTDPKSKLNIAKYIKYKKGKRIIKKTTIKTFLDKLSEVLEELDQNVRQSKLSEFVQPKVDVSTDELENIDWERLFPDETHEEA